MESPTNRACDAACVFDPHISYRFSASTLLHWPKCVSDTQEITDTCP